MRSDGRGYAGDRIGAQRTAVSQARGQEQQHLQNHASRIYPQGTSAVFRCCPSELLKTPKSFVWKRQASFAREESTNHASPCSPAERLSASHTHLCPAILTSPLDLTLLTRRMMLQPCIILAVDP